MKHYQVLVIGGGTAGIMVSSQLKKENASLSIGLVEPAKTHYYQPAWTLVGADAYNYEDTARPMASLIPAGVDWIQDYATGFDPDNNKLHCKEGDYTYDYLVVAPGIKIDCSLVEGLSEAIDKGVVCSNYTDPKHTWKVLQNFKGGTALFTQPTTPIKCGGAPQKIMYLAADHFKKAGLKDKTNITFASPGSKIFGVKPIAETLMEVVDRKDIHLRFGHRLVKVDGPNQIAWFEMADHKSLYNEKAGVKIEEKDGLVGIHYDMMHLAPPQTAPDFVKNSVLASEAGWVEVNIETMQHVKFPNIFSLGDVAQLPTAKTGAAIRKQAPIVVESILRLMKGQDISAKRYNGYSSCPLVTGYGKMALAEFDYKNNFIPDPKLKQMLVFNSAKEHWRLWMLKKYMLPYLYWNYMMKGKQV